MTTDKRCPNCGGQGCWQTECCDGSDGCSCRGGLVDMGTCNCCGGTGIVDESYDKDANVRSLQGVCFAGSGPSVGYWAGRGKRLYR
jgi:hypothetical protein